MRGDLRGVGRIVGVNRLKYIVWIMNFSKNKAKYLKRKKFKESHLAFTPYIYIHMYI